MTENENNKEFVYENLRKFNKSNRFYLTLMAVTFSAMILSIAFVLYNTYNRYNRSLEEISSKYSRSFEVFKESLIITESQLLFKLDSLSTLIEAQKVNLELVDDRNLQSFDQLGNELNKLWRVSYARNSQDIKQLKGELNILKESLKSSSISLSERIGTNESILSNFETDYINWKNSPKSEWRINSSLINQISIKIDTINSRVMTLERDVSEADLSLKSYSEIIKKASSLIRAVNGNKTDTIPE